MKRFLALSILFAALSSSFMSTFSWAEEGNTQTINPGDEPNEGKPSPGPRRDRVEAEVGFIPFCETCVRRLIDKVIHAETNHARHPVTSTSPNQDTKQASPTPGTK